MATTIRNKNLFCLNCGGEFMLNYPVPIDEMTKKMKAFDELHKDCKPTWKEPTIDQSKNVKEKAMQWMAMGERGSSSEAMWFCLMEQPMGNKSHPCDPDDFKRCYKLLQAVPEWKDELHKLKALSPVWSKLVDNWDILTVMYEENIRTNWKNYKKIGMYEHMESLGC